MNSQTAIKKKVSCRALLLLLGAAWLCGALMSVVAQTRVPTTRDTAEPQATGSGEQSNGAQPMTARLDKTAPPGDSFFTPIYRNFYEHYRIGPGDHLAIRVAFQPDYTIEQAKVSPVGRVYHPLLGDVEVVGLTIEQLTRRLGSDLSEYLLAPKVSVELLEANSAKIAVLGEVRAPGIIVMARPMTVLDAIGAAGGFADTGNRSRVTLLRQGGGRLVESKVNVKRIIEGKSSLEADLTLRAGDTLIIHGNTKKKLNEISSLVGFATFVAFLAR